MKKILFVFLFLSSFFSCNLNLAMDDSDDFDIFSDDNLEVGSFLDHHDFSLGKGLGPKDVIGILVDALQVDRILKQNFFLKTYPLNYRRLVDNPLFLMDKDFNYGNWLLDFHLFYDQTYRMHFVNRSTGCKCDDKRASGICSYLGITEPALLSALENTKEQVDLLYPGNDYNIVKILSLFKNIKVQERRAGLFLGFMAKVKKFHISLQTPFYYVIRNFFLCDDERKAIEKEMSTITPGKTSEAEAIAFARKHLISDRLGFGNLRFSFDYPVNDNGGFDFRLGLFADIPSTFSIVKGLYGSTFCPVIKRPSIDLVELLDLAQEGFANGDEDAKNEVICRTRSLGEKVLDSLSSMLVDPNMGRRRHFGLGLYMKTFTPLRSIWNTSWTQNLYLKGRISLEYLFPSKECRWFIEKCDPTSFDVRDWDSDEMALENLVFLEKMIIDKVFPYVYETIVRPGLIFQWTSKLTYEAKRWGIHLGTDTWIQSSEKLYEICAPSCQQALLDTCKATRPWAYQWTVLGTLFFKSKRKKSTLYIGLNAEKTVSSRGIGKPFKVSLSFERNF